MSIERPLMGRGYEADDIIQQHRREVGKFIRHVRLHRGLTQEQLGALLGIGNTAVSNAELGRSGLAPDLFGPLVDALEMDPAVFGRVLLRWLNPWIYVLIYGRSTIQNLPQIPRRAYRKGPGADDGGSNGGSLI